MWESEVRDRAFHLRLWNTQLSLTTGAVLWLSPTTTIFMCPPLQSRRGRGGKIEFPVCPLSLSCLYPVAATLVLQTDGSYRQNELFWIGLEMTKL